MPKVSVIMPTYNAGPRIGAAISGVLAQSHSDLELIVVDDGSTDDTHQIASGFGDRITLVQQDNAGPNAARNAGIRSAGGEIIALCDSDDVLLPNYLADAVTVLGSSPPRSWVTCAALALTDHGLSEYGISPFGSISPDDQREAILQVNFVSIFSVFPRRMVDDVGYFSESLQRCEDWDYWARSIFSGWRVAYQPKPAALYRQQGTSQSSDSVAMLDAEDTMIAGLTELFQETFTPRERELLASRAARGSVDRQRLKARQAWETGEFRSGARLLRTAAADYPYHRGLRRKAMIAGLVAPVLELLPERLPLREKMRERW